MTLDPIMAIPAVASAGLIFTSSVESAFYRVYLPVLLLLPSSHLWGWPLFNFNEYAIVPIGVVLLWWAINGRWKVSAIDFVVLAFVMWVFISDTHTSGFSDVAQRFADPVALAVFPYMAGKLLIEQTGIRNAIIRRFVFLLFLDALFCFFEFRLGVNPLRMFFNAIFSSPDNWPTQTRYGFGRAAGPFGHPIFMGTIVAIAILLHQYATHFSLWERTFRWLHTSRLTKAGVIWTALVAGSIMTISRGPWIAVVVGGIVSAIGRSGDRWQALRRTLFILTVGGALLYVGGKAYVAGVDVADSPEEVSSAKYRAELLHQYRHIALVQSFWGWGSPDWPKVPGMVSIDNWYLLVMLMHGVTGLVLFGVMITVPTTRLIWVGLIDQDLSPDLRAMIFTMAGILTLIAVSVATVFLGGQLYPLLFLFLGWSDACLTYRPRTSTALTFLHFRRVLA